MGERCDMEVGPCACGATHSPGESFRPMTDPTPSEESMEKARERVGLWKAAISS
jgi:hypothetical protein